LGLEIEFEYDDTQDGVWSPAPEPGQPRRWLSRRPPPRRPAGNPLIVQLGIALAAVVLGAASMAGFLHGRTAVTDRAVTLLHLAPVNPFVVQPLPAPPIDPPSAEQLLTMPWTNAVDRDVSLSVINDGPDPVTVLGATLSALDFPATELSPVGSAPTAPGGVSPLRGRAHFVCGDYLQGRTATVARLRVRTADGAIRPETLVVDDYSQIAERTVCAQMPTPQVVESTTFAPTRESVVYVADITAVNRAPFPLRMALPESAVQTWTRDGGLYLSAPGDTIIPPHGTGTLAITVKVTECPLAQQAASNGEVYDTLAFSDARDAPGAPQARMIDQTAAIADLNSITAYCLANAPASDGG
jgi:hypothetical protein